MNRAAFSELLRDGERIFHRRGVRHIAPLGIPVFRGSMIGHVSGQFTLPIGGRAEMDADRGRIRLLEPAVL